MSRLHHQLGLFGSCPILLLQDRRLKPNSLRVYLAIQSYQGTADQAWPSREALAARAGVSAQMVSSAVRQLVATGWLAQRRRFGQSTVYSCLSFSDPVPEFETEDGRRRRSPERTGDGKFSSPPKSTDNCGETARDHPQFTDNHRPQFTDNHRPQCTAPKSPSEKPIDKTTAAKGRRASKRPADPLQRAAAASEGVVRDPEVARMIARLAREMRAGGRRSQ